MLLPTSATSELWLKRNIGSLKTRENGLVNKLDHLFSPLDIFFQHTPLPKPYLAPALKIKKHTFLARTSSQKEILETAYSRG